jgi:tungstate transport system substrate-binding protein
MKKNASLNFLFILIMLLVLVGCSESNLASEPPSALSPDQIILATTTSTQDSGLLDYLLPIFHEQSGYIVKTIAVGTGKALKMAEDGNADVLLVHAPSAEKELMDKGYGSDRFLIMHNDFVVVGPPDNPARIIDARTIFESFQAINDSKSTFVSRGDDSGTHKKEMEFWNEIGISPQGDWYLESGQGMAASLRIASEKNAYTLTDRATYLANLETLDLAIHVEGDNQLLNVYHVIVVNPEKWPQVNFEGAHAFALFLTSEDTQSLIGEFGIEQFGQPLFTPDADKTDLELGSG